MTILFKNFTSGCAPLFIDNVDTDQIFPARYLTVTDKKGLGELLFKDLRFKEDGTTRKPEFTLNKSEYKEAKILLAHENFGCGSSREHAPWALLGYGFRAVVAISFADIFRNNALKNGLIVIELSRDIVDQMHKDVKKNPKEKGSVDLNTQTFTWKGMVYPFQINGFVKKCLLEGLDDIGYTLSFEKDIEAYEKLQDAAKIKK